jgi:hypothetical protein
VSASDISPALPGVTAASIEPMLAGGRWIRSAKPFPHIVATNVFTADSYARLEASFLRSIGRVLGRGYLEKHDIHGTTLLPTDTEAFAPLLSRGWHDLLAGLLGIPATGHVMCGVHHHTTGGDDGFPHNDLNPGWFDGDPQSGSVELSSPYTVDYMSGQVLAADAHPREMVRAAAVLLYLANDPWSPGVGGETGLYRTAADPVDQPVARVPPINNSLLAFECTPRSYHGFISNTRSPRNSIVMWLHRPKEEVTGRWGDDAIVPYGLRPKSRPSTRRSASDR